MTLPQHETHPTDADVERWLDQLDPRTIEARDAAHFRAIIAASQALAAAEQDLRQAVASARAAGNSWAIVGAALGTTKQAAQQRFGQGRATTDVPVTRQPYGPEGAIRPDRPLKERRDRKMAENGNDRHVVPNADGGWDVKAGDAQRSSAHAGTQQQAIDRARQIVHNAGGGEVIIHGRDGQIRDKDTIAPGNDPFPPKG